jgi:hypothetical protein
MRRVSVQADDGPSSLESLLTIAGGYVLSRCLHVVANLAVADALDGSPRSAAELADAVGANSAVVDRVSHPPGGDLLLRSGRRSAASPEGRHLHYGDENSRGLGAGNSAPGSPRRQGRLRDRAPVYRLTPM